MTNPVELGEPSCCMRGLQEPAGGRKQALTECRLCARRGFPSPMGHLRHAGLGGHTPGQEALSPRMQMRKLRLKA